MQYPEFIHDAALPFTWIPTKGNDIPARAVPLHEGPDGQLLYIARGLLGGDVQIGTTSYASTEGARLRDKHGRIHTTFEYEVLTLASSVRFQLAQPQPPASAETTPRLPARTVTTRTPHPIHSPMPKRTPGKLEPFPWIGSVRGSPSPKERGGKRIQNDPPPYTSPIGGWTEVPKQVDSVNLGPRESVQFKHLAQSKCFTLIDDTPSMQTSWSQTRAALAGTIDMLSSDDQWDGVDIKFLNHSEGYCGVKTTQEFERVFSSVTTLGGEKVMTTKVTQVFEESLALVHERSVVLLIITDGIMADSQQLLSAMIGFCQRLNGKRVPAHMFRIHILQMGNDRKAVQPLHDFRDRITQRDRDRRILNVVSYHRARGPLNAQHIVKLLVASTDIPVDEDPDLRERLPPKVVGAQYQELDRIRMMGSR